MQTDSKNKNHHFTYRISVNNSKANVWSYLTNVNRWKEWDTEILESSIEGRFRENAQGLLTPKKGPKLKFWISEIVDDSSYTFITKMPVGHLEIKRSIEQKGEYIVFTDDIQFTGILKRLFGLLLGKGFKKVLPEVMQNFKIMVEKQTK